MSLREQMVQVARAWIKAHNDRSPDAIRALAADDFVAHFFPASLPAQGDKDREGYVDMIVDESQRKVVIYLDSRGTAAVPGVIDLYKNQYVHKITLTDDVKLVKVFDSFIDSQAMMAFMGKVFAATGVAPEGK
ncbi:hypothetical protein B0T26DRAFT_876719 [Lasiosphaeria miniovina]|uniref:SnoaL-like domain-containing protein n=1 Tax=Lasiosphaeria miniovina TaxID=1954250 RepID=A0AA39ZU98_9PEZI|nr:uncharacterized protein B0T26DRAFT_876719 [Lasiosphaeria miniovina]KAK0703846.1 hypothetical protein B0T26DRAFT_876719 [Lasiosphaeria miniovina]